MKNRSAKYSPPPLSLLSANKNSSSSGFREILQSKEFRDNPSPLTVALGKNEAGRDVVVCLDKMPHLLIGGAAGTGKSVCLHAMLLGLLFKSSPADVRLILAAQKSAEFTAYEGLPHLLGGEILSKEGQTVRMFDYLLAETERRQELLTKSRAKSFADYNKTNTVKSGFDARLPYIVTVVDEFSELAPKEIETRLGALCEKAAAVGIHIVLTTQKTSTEIISGTVKAAIQGRIAFWVPSTADSRAILDCTGAETLSGVGHMLFMSHEMNEPRNVRASFVTGEEVSAVTGYVKSRNSSEYDKNFISAVNGVAEADGADPLTAEILNEIITAGSVSTGMLQRKFALGYARANQIIVQLEAEGIIGPVMNGNTHTVYMSREQFTERFGADTIGQELKNGETEEFQKDSKKQEKQVSKKAQGKNTDESVSAVIKVIGIGAGGINSANRLIAAGLKPEQVIAIDADASALSRCEAKVKINIGGKRGQTARAEDEAFDKNAAEEHARAIADAIGGSDIVFLTVGAGFGVGTGAALVCSKIAAEMGIVTIAFVTKPFGFEGKARASAAAKGTEELRVAVDILTEISSEKLMELGGDLPVGEAYKFADEALFGAITGIGDLFTSPALIGFDFKDLLAVLRLAGTAHFGVGNASGENRAEAAVKEAAENIILGTSVAGATQVIINIVGPKDLSLREINETAKMVSALAGGGAAVTLGADIRTHAQNGITVTVIASGFKTKQS